ncbi:hypothetical protein, partial [Streptomyces sp. MBT97]|uniref:hypothetical protein n=1 Tax=Streptomyces sp. MBT97 TaxID=2800411 RepID=UPI001F1A9034
MTENAFTRTGHGGASGKRTRRETLSGAFREPGREARRESDVRRDQGLPDFGRPNAPQALIPP